MRLALLVFAACLTLTQMTYAHAATITFVKHDKIDFIAIDGEIEVSDVDKFRDLAIKSSNAVVILNSPGGYLSPALEIGKIIQVKGFTTYVPAGVICTSSCALIWVAGAPRMLSTKSRIGFHASYQDDNGAPKETGLGNAMVGRYLTLLNLPEKAVMFATRASPDTIQWLNTSEAMEAGMPYETIDLKDIESSERVDISPSNASANVVSPTAPSVPRVLSPILAGSDYEWINETWMVLSTSNRDGCIILNEFTSEDGLSNKSQLTISKYRNQTHAILSFKNEKFRSVKNGQSYKINMIFKTKEKIDRGWGEKEFEGIIYKDGSKGLLVNLDWDELERDMSDEDNIYFLLDGKLIDQYPLAGSTRAFREMNNCLSTNLVRRLDDPFSN